MTGAGVLASQAMMERAKEPGNVTESKAYDFAPRVYDV